MNVQLTRYIELLKFLCKKFYFPPNKICIQVPEDGRNTCDKNNLPYVSGGYVSVILNSVDCFMILKNCTRSSYSRGSYLMNATMVM